MTKGRTSVMVAAMVLVGVLAAGCGGKKNDVAADGQVQTTAESAETLEETTVEQTTAEQTTEASTKEEAAAATEAETTKAAPTETRASKAETTKAAPKNETKAETKAAPKAEAPKAPAPAQAAPAPAPTEPVHEHVWKEHTATRDEWVPNVVTVPDYETKKVPVRSDVHCNCGAVFIDGAGAEDHAFAHIMAGEDDGYWDIVVYEEQTVQVGSHEEDQGHYETVTYTDYWYCECGATK